MDALNPLVDAIVSDAAYASVPGAIGNAPDRSGALVVTPAILGFERQTTPSPSAMSVAIDGPGMFVFEHDGRREFGRLGDFRIGVRGVLVDSSGRTVLGFVGAAPDRANAGLGPIRLPAAAELTSESNVSIDSRGFVSVHDSIVGQIAVAVFAASERLARVSATTAAQTSASGDAIVTQAGSPNVGTLHSHRLENGLVDIEADFKRLWDLRRLGEIEATAAYAADGCERTAMALVR